MLERPYTPKLNEDPTWHSGAIYLFIDLIKVPTTEYKYIKYTSIN